MSFHVKQEGWVKEMPLKKGLSPKTQRSNIKELVDSYDSSGKIGNSKPKNKKKAIKQAIAISYAEKKRKS